MTTAPTLTSSLPTGFRKSAIRGLLLLAVSVSNASALEPPKDGKLTAEVVGSVTAKLIMPVTYSHDGASLLYFVETQTHGFEYWLANADGTGSLRIHTTPAAGFDWDDYLNPFTGPSLTDGKGHTAVATTTGEKPHDNDVARFRVGVVGSDGKLTTLGSKMGFVSGYGFAGNDLLFLDSAFPGPGYRLEKWQGQEQQTLFQSKDGRALVLHVSPTNRHAAFFEINPEKGNLRLRIVDLESGQASDSGWFFSGGYVFDGGPALYWDAKGQSVFYHECEDGWKKNPFSLMRFDLKTKTATKVTALENTAVVAVLDDDHLAVSRLSSSTGGVLRLSDGKTFVLPGKSSILGGHGQHLAVVNSRTMKVDIVRFELNE